MALFLRNHRHLAAISENESQFQLLSLQYWPSRLACPRYVRITSPVTPPLPCLLSAPAATPKAGRGNAHCIRQGLSRPTERERRAPTLWRRGEVQLDRLAAGTRARLGGEFSGAGLEDQRRNLLGAVDADPGAEQPAARAVATRLVRCQSEALAHNASTLAAAWRAVNPQ